MKNKTRIVRDSILLLIDFTVLFLSLILSKWLISGNIICTGNEIIAAIAFSFLSLIIIFTCKVYKIRLLESSLELLVRVLTATFIIDFFSCFAFYAVTDCVDSFTYILRWAIVFGFFVFIVLTGYRVCYRLFYNFKHFKKASAQAQKSAVVYGAGEIGMALAQQYQKGKLEYNIVGFIDDDPKYQSTLVKNIPVLGTSKDIEQVLIKTKAEYFIVAITTLSAEKMHEVIEATNKVKVKLLLIPSLFEMKSNNESYENINLRSLNLEDLLGRRLIEIDKKPIQTMVEGKVVMVTGAGGSIGSEICKQLLTFKPKQLLLLDIDETELHDLSLRLHSYKEEFSRDIFPICCDIKNKAKIEHIFEAFKPEIVFHAAAYKHVPMMEYYPEEAIRTNIKGSYNVLAAACKNNAQKVIVISTDKAVNPTNVMGATKRFVELEASLLNNSSTEIVCVRFGNVLGSRGSMLPLFLDQIKEGVPITVTHKDIIRYFMAIPEAVSLVFLAGAMAKGGEVMVLDMGEPVKIYDFATRLVKYFGDGRSKVVVTGLRPGEKLYEELLANKDLTIPTDNNKVFKARVTGSLNKEWLEAKLETIEEDSVEDLLTNLEQAIPEFHYQGKAPLSDMLN